MTVPPYVPAGTQTEPGLSPNSASDVNVQVGSLMRQFTAVKEAVDRQHNWLETADLKLAPYNMEADDETLIKSAVADLDAALDAVNMTFINRLTGLY